MSALDRLGRCSLTAGRLGNSSLQRGGWGAGVGSAAAARLRGYTTIGAGEICMAALRRHQFHHDATGDWRLATGTGYMTKPCRRVEDLAVTPRDAWGLATAIDVETTRTFFLAHTGDLDG